MCLNESCLRGTACPTYCGSKKGGCKAWARARLTSDQRRWHHTGSDSISSARCFVPALQGLFSSSLHLFLLAVHGLAQAIHSSLNYPLRFQLFFSSLTSKARRRSPSASQPTKPTNVPLLPSLIPELHPASSGKRILSQPKF